MQTDTTGPGLATGSGPPAAPPPGGPGPDMGEVMKYAERVTADLAGAMTAVLCALGTRLGLFRALAGTGPATPAELAAAAGLAERYVREWTHGLAAAGYLDAAPDGERFTLPEGLVPILAAEGSPFAMAPAYDLPPAMTGMLGPVGEAFRTGEGVANDAYPAALYEAMEAMSATWIDSMLAHRWIPSVDGLAERLREGGRVADVGCGGGRALLRCAEAYPAAGFVGYDTHGRNVERARRAAAEAGAAGRITVEQADAADALDGYFDLVVAFDVLHDAPSPARLLERVRAATEPDGVLLLLESRAADSPLGNTGPASVILYATSVLYCLPTSIANGGPGLGTLGLPAERIRELCSDAGFRSVRTVPTPSPFNALYEIRP